MYLDDAPQHTRREGDSARAGWKRRGKSILDGRGRGIETGGVVKLRGTARRERQEEAKCKGREREQENHG